MSAVINPIQSWNIVAQGGLVQNAPQKLLIIGQIASNATVPADEIVTNIGNEGQENVLFGQRSMLATMARAIKRVNKFSQLDALPLADPSSGPAEAEATLTFGGTATQAGTLRVAIQSERYFIFEVGVPVGTTGAALAALFNTAVNANDEVLVTSGEAAGVVTLTAHHPGTEGNSLKYRVIENAPGITLTTTPFAGGAGAVAAIDFDTVIGERRYQGIVIPSSYATNLTALSDYLTSVYNVTNMIKNGVGFACYAAASGSAAVTFANPFNNKSLVVFSDEVIATNDQRGGYIVEYNPVIACEFAAIRALRMTPNANIAQYLVGNNIANTTGGVYRAALPYHQTPFIDLPVVVKGRGWSFADQTLLNSNGVSFLGNNAAASAVVCGDVVTTYRDADGTFKYLNTVDTISAVREFFFNQCQQQFAQSVLTDGDLTGPNTINNAQSIRAYLGNLYQILAGRDFGLCQAGAAAQRFFNDNLQVEVIMLTGTVNITAVVPIVSQMRGINGTIQLTFNI